MPFTLTMPKLSPTMEEGTIVAWHKKAGEFVEPGDLLFEVATDKATVEHTALDEGWLRQILIEEGGEAVVNQPVAIFSEEEGEDVTGYEPEGIKRQEAPVSHEEQSSEGEVAGAQPPPSLSAAPQGQGLAQPLFAPEPPLEDYVFEWPIGSSQSGGGRASPLARKLAAQQRLDLFSVKGSGPGGRIVAKDLDRAQPLSSVSGGRREEPTLAPGSYAEEKLTPMRKAIGKRLQEAKTFIPHFYVRQSIDAQPMIQLRSQLKELGMKVTFNDFITRACALALVEHPGVNSGMNTENQTITRYQTVDVAIAVAMDEGLITPIIRHTDHKTLAEIGKETRLLAQRARSGKLEPHEYKGGSFTISNLGMYGIDDFIAVINPPQGAILSVGGILDQPVVKEGEVVAGKVMNLILSSDHRVIDGALAAEFLQAVKKRLENPISLVL